MHQEVLRFASQTSYLQLLSILGIARGEEEMNQMDHAALDDPHIHTQDLARAQCSPPYQACQLASALQRHMQHLQQDSPYNSQRIHDRKDALFRLRIR